MVQTTDIKYHHLIGKVLDSGVVKDDRTGVGTISLHHQFESWSLKDGRIPMLSTRKIGVKMLLGELEWFISGQTRLKPLIDAGSNFWNSWVLPGTEKFQPLTARERAVMAVANGSYPDLNAVEKAYHGLREAPVLGSPMSAVLPINVWGEDSLYPTLQYRDQNTVMHALLDQADVPRDRLLDGDLGPVYGAQWRKWSDTQVVQLSAARKYIELGYETLSSSAGCLVMHRTIDQLKEVELALRNNPNSRRIVLTAWNPADLHRMALPPCHMSVIFTVANNTLDAMLVMRSNDLILGHPYNIAEYSVLTHVLAHTSGLRPGKLSWVCADAHVYSNQVDTWLAKQSSRINDTSLQSDTARITINPDLKSVLDFKSSDVTITGYNPLAAIRYPEAAV